jgi:TP901 family phage tail tape measure protein
MSLSSRDVLLMIRARDYASREIRNVGGAFGALGKAIHAVDTRLNNQLNRSMQTQSRMIQQNTEDAARYANTINNRLTRSINKQNEALYQTRRATERDIQGHKDAQTVLSARNRQLESQNALIRASSNQQATATAQAKQYYSQMRNITKDGKEGTAAQKEQLNLYRRQHDQLSKGTLTWQKYIQQRQAEKTLNNEQKGLIDQQIESRRRLGRAQIEQINTTAKREQEMLQESARRYGEMSRTHQAHLKKVGAAERKAYEEEAQRSREVLQRHQRNIAMLMGVGIAATITGAAMLSFGRKGVKALSSMAMESANFQRDISLAMTQIQNDSPATVRSLVNIGREIGTEIPASMDTMASTLFFIFSSLRVNTEQAKFLLRGFAKEAVAGNTNIEAAARSTIAILNGMGLTVEDLTRVQDMQFQTVRRGVITYEQLSANIGKLIPALRRSGQEIETGGAMLAFLTRQGLSAEMSATAAARSLELIADPRVVKRLEDQGIAVRDLKGEFLPLVEILTQMNERFGSLPGPERAQALLEIFGGAGYRIQARRFFDTVFANFDHFLWQIGELENASGAMQRAYDIVFKEPLTQIQLFKNNLAVLRMEVGDRFLPIMAQVVDRGLELIDWFRNLDESTKDTLAQLAAFSSVAAVVGGSILILGGTFLIVTALIGHFTSSMAMAVAITSTFPVLVAAISGALVYLALNYDDLSGSIDRMADALGISGQQLNIFLTLLASAGAVAVVYKLYMLQATGAVGAFFTSIKALAAANPILTGLLVILGAVTAAVYLMGKRSREVNKISKELASSLDSAMVAFANGTSNVKNYSKVMQDAQRSTVEQILAERELQDAIYNSPFTTKEIVDGILDVNNARWETLDAIQAQIDKEVELQRSGNVVGAVSNDTIRDLAKLRDAYEDASNAVVRANKRQIEAWRDEGGLNGLIAEYIDLMERGPDHLTRSLTDSLYEQIIAATELSMAWGELPEEVRLALQEMDGGEEVLESLGAAAERVKQQLDVMSDSWNAIGGVVNSVVDTYNEKLEEFNTKNREAAEEAGRSYEDITHSLELFSEAMDETTNELDWALDAQRQLREQYSGDVISWWSQLYQDEPELAKAIHEKLLEGDTTFYEQMRENRIKAMDFILADIEAFGLPFINQHGEIYDNVVDIVATAMGMHPELVRHYLEETNGIARARMGEYVTIMDTLSTEALTTLERNLSTMSQKEKDFHLMGDSWGRALVNGVNAGINNTRIRTVTVPIRADVQGHDAAFIRNALRKNKGGYIPGSGPDRDSVLVHGTPREFVIRRKAADTLSPAFLHALNTHGADVFKGKGLGVPTVGSGAPTGSQGSAGDRIYQYMPNAQVIVQEPGDIEIELAKFENWLRSEQP